MIKELKRLGCRYHLDKPYHFFRLLFTPFGHLRNFVLFPIGVFLRKHGICSSKDKKITILKNRHSGERVFVVCSGPSLTPSDVLLIKDEYTIGMNSIFRMSEKIDWKPSYYMFLETGGLERFLKISDLDLRKVSTEYSIINSLDSKFANDPKVLLLHYCWLDHYFLWGSKTFKYDPELFHGMYDFYSTGHAAVLLAIYMGFKDIFLLGVDNDFSGKKLHFDNAPGLIDSYSDEEKLGPGLRMQICMDMGWKEIAKIGKQMGVNIYNSTRGGRVEAFPRVKLEDVVAGNS